MLKHRTILVLLLILLVATTGVVSAQQPSPGGPAAPGARAIERPLAPIEGTVKKVDPAARTVQISTGFFGIFGRTLEVTDETQIQIEGREATLAELQEGAKVKASYELREGKSVVTRIEAMSPQTDTSPASKTQ